MNQEERLIIDLTNPDGEVFSSEFKLVKLNDQRRDNRVFGVTVLNGTNQVVDLQLEFYNETLDTWTKVVREGENVVISVLASPDPSSNITEFIEGYSNVNHYRFSTTLSTATGSLQVYIVESYIEIKAP